MKTLNSKLKKLFSRASLQTCRNSLLTSALLFAFPLGIIPAVYSAESERGLIYSGQGPTNFMSSLFGGIQDSEYEIRWQESAGALQSPNRANNLRFTYLPTGFQAARRAPVEDTDLWSAGIFLTGLGQRRGFAPDPHAVLASQKKQAMIKHDSLTIEYINDADGMRQNFILDRKPTPQPGLVLSFTVELEGLIMSVDAAGKEVWFDNLVTGEPEFGYLDLNVWDSTGRVLPAQFQALSAAEFTIAVDDANAAYPITVDPLSQTPHRNYSQTQSGCKFGFSVAQRFQSCGGSHLIIGAPYYDNGQTDEGRVFVYHDTCSGGFSSSPDWTAESNQASAHFGWSVAALDANSDNYMDFAVGAPLYGTYDDGAVFIWHGSSSGFGSDGTPSNADWSAYGEQNNWQFGYSVAGVPSLRADDYDSLAVGSPYYDYNSNYYTGKVYLFYGTVNGIGTTADWTATGSALYEFFGWSVADAGDVNFDGDHELMVGAPTANGSYGQVKIWYGSASGLGSSPDRTLSDSQLASDFGWSVSTAGDVNDDGYDDIIVGAPSYDNGQSNEGRISVYHGSSTGIGTSAAWTAESNQAGAKLGFSVATAGDYDVDGISSIIAGAPYYDFTNTDDGRAFVWDGSSSGLGSNGIPSNADWAMSDIGPSHLTGYTVGAFSQTYFRGVILGVPGANTVTLFAYSP